MPTRLSSIRERLTTRGVEFARDVGGSRLGVWLVGHVVSPLQRWLYRTSNGRLSLTGRAPVLLLTTTGRRSGKPRTVPVFYLRDGERVILCNVTPPYERTNPWTLNLRADPLASVQIREQVLRCHARETSDNELAAYWPALTEIWPAYQRFFDAGGRRSVFVLEPMEAS